MKTCCLETLNQTKMEEGSMRSGEEGRGDPEGMIRRLYKASLSGSLSSLIQLIEEDELILDRVIITCFNETPLHVAAMLGHVEFAREILRCKPELATELNSESSSPLHLASAKGNLEMVKELLNINPSVCLVTDRNGRTPLHLATIKGRIDVMKELIQARPEVIHVRVDRGETVLHLCVKNSRLEALKLLLESAAISEQQQQLLNSKDDDGNTVLHLATAMKQIEVIKLLVDKNGVEINAMNSFGNTALDILAQSPPPRDTKDMDIGDSLRAAGALKADDIIKLSSMPITSSRSGSNRNSREMKMQSVYPDQGGDWLVSQKNSLMVVSTVIAAMAFQGILSPPNKNDSANGSQAKNDSNSYFYTYYYDMFFITNTVSFFGSLCTTLLLVSGFSMKKKPFVWVLMVSMWITITASASSYCSLLISAGDPSSTTIIVSVLTGFGWMIVVALVFLIHTIRMVLRCVNGFPLIPRILIWIFIPSSIIALVILPLFRLAPSVQPNLPIIFGGQLFLFILYPWVGMVCLLLLLLGARFVFWCVNKLRRTTLDEARQRLRLVVMKMIDNANQSSVTIV